MSNRKENGFFSLFKKGDLVLIALICLLALLPLLFFARQEGRTAVVRVEGKVVCTISLEEDGSYPIQTAFGENLLQVKDGGICMLEADCPDGLCVRQGEIRRLHETIACLPHRLSVTIEGGEGGTAYDAIVK